MNSEHEIEKVVRGFETCETSASEFKHKDHLVVAVWYVHNLGKEAALERMREGLLRFIGHHGVDPKKYSETITRFWIERVDQRLNELGSDVSLVEKCNEVLATDFSDEG
ncbi:MAG TPA: hypothetical protein VHS05_01580 [Pyrinomonadaceae bacterium]|jgi:hypothetical protein|nr:hypothetical protein [Pyrinomonadaceae bacterium]